jgi:hypothetical protein
MNGFHPQNRRSRNKQKDKDMGKRKNQAPAGLKIWRTTQRKKKRDTRRRNVSTEKTLPEPQLTNISSLSMEEQLFVGHFNLISKS